MGGEESKYRLPEIDPGMTSLGVILSEYKKTNLTFFEMLIAIGNRIPQILCGLVGLEDWYWISVYRFGQETWWAPHNILRQVTHFAGGIAMSFPFVYWMGLPHFGLFFVMGYTITRETLEVIEDGFYFKNVLDVVFWTSGALFLIYLVLS